MICKEDKAFDKPIVLDFMENSQAISTRLTTAKDENALCEGN